MIVVGAENPEVARILGWDSAPNMDEALAMAQSYLGRRPSVTMMHFAPILMADVIGAPQTA